MCDAMLVVAVTTLLAGLGSRLALTTPALLLSTPDTSGTATILSVWRTPTDTILTTHRTGRAEVQLTLAVCALATRATRAAETIRIGRFVVNVMTTSAAGSGP